MKNIKLSPAKITAIVLGSIVIIVVAWMIIQPLFIKDDTTDPNTNALTYTNYMDTRSGASLQFPTSWTKTQSQPGTVSFADASGANVSFVVEDISKNPLTLAEYTEAALAAIESLDFGFQLTDAYDSTTAGYPSYTIEYTAENETLKAQALGVWFIKGEKAYVLTYTAPEDIYTTHEATAKKIIESIQVQ